MKKTLLFIMVLCLACAVYADQKFTFETGTTTTGKIQGWTNYAGYGNVNAVFSISAVTAHTGTKSLLAFGTLTNNQHFDIGYDNGYMGRPNDTTHIIWLYTPTTTLFVKFSWDDPAYTYGEGAGANLTTNVWQQFAISTSYGASKPFRRWGIEAGNFSGASVDVSLYIDDAEFDGSGPEILTFDNSTESWTIFAGYGGQSVTLAVDSVVKFQGAASLKVTSSVVSSGQKIDIGNDGKYAMGSPSDNFVQMWVYSDDTNFVGQFIKFSMSDNGYGYLDSGSAGSPASGNYATVSTWQLYKWNVSEVKRPFIRFGMEAFNGTGKVFTGSFWVDNVGTDPSTLVPVELSNFEATKFD